MTDDPYSAARFDERDEYTGLSGRASFLALHREPQEMIDEANRQDGVRRAAYWIEMRKRELDPDGIGDTTKSNWIMATRLMNDRTVRQFVKQETDIELLQGILKREAQRGEPRKKLIGTINERIQELR